MAEGIDVNESIKSKECGICHYWYFLNKGFKPQSYVCNRCHDLSMMFMNLSDNAVLSIKGADYYCIISVITKTQILLSYIKMCKAMLKFGDIEIDKKISPP